MELKKKVSTYPQNPFTMKIRNVIIMSLLLVCMCTAAALTGTSKAAVAATTPPFPVKEAKSAQPSPPPSRKGHKRARPATRSVEKRAAAEAQAKKGVRSPRRACTHTQTITVPALQLFLPSAHQLCVSLLHCRGKQSRRVGGGGGGGH